MSGIETVAEERDAIDQRTRMALTCFQQREMQVSRVERETGEGARNEALRGKDYCAGRVGELIDVSVIDEIVAHGPCQRPDGGAITAQDGRGFRNFRASNLIKHGLGISHRILWIETDNDEPEVG